MANEDERNKFSLTHTFKYLMGQNSSIFHSFCFFFFPDFFFVSQFSYLFLFLRRTATQILSRGIPFFFNAWIVRHLTEEDYAVFFLFFVLFALGFFFGGLIYFPLGKMNACAPTGSHYLQ